MDSFDGAQPGAADSEDHADDDDRGDAARSSLTPPGEKTSSSAAPTSSSPAGAPVPSPPNKSEKPPATLADALSGSSSTSNSTTPLAAAMRSAERPALASAPADSSPDDEDPDEDRRKSSPGAAGLHDGSRSTATARSFGSKNADVVPSTPSSAGDPDKTALSTPIVGRGSAGVPALRNPTAPPATGSADPQPKPPPSPKGAGTPKTFPKSKGSSVGGDGSGPSGDGVGVKMTDHAVGSPGGESRRPQQEQQQEQQSGGDGGGSHQPQQSGNKNLGQQQGTSMGKNQQPDVQVVPADDDQQVGAKSTLPSAAGAATGGKEQLQVSADGKLTKLLQVDTTTEGGAHPAYSNGTKRTNDVEKSGDVYGESSHQFHSSEDHSAQSSREDLSGASAGKAGHDLAGRAAYAYRKAADRNRRLAAAEREIGPPPSSFAPPNEREPHNEPADIRSSLVEQHAGVGYSEFYAQHLKARIYLCTNPGRYSQCYSRPEDRVELCPGRVVVVSCSRPEDRVDLCLGRNVGLDPF